MKKRILSILLAVVMLATMLPLYSVTSTALSSGGFEYEIISETEKTASIVGYSGSETDVVVPSTLDGYTVIAIGDMAFAENYELTSVTLPDTIISIGSVAFAYCISLTKIEISKSVEEIGIGAFVYCLQLTDFIVDPANNTFSSVDGVLFDKAQTTLLSYPVGKADSEYIFPETTTTIGAYSFFCAYQLTKIDIPDSVTTIESYAFSYSEALAEVTLSSNLESMGDNAFDGCISLTGITIPDSLTEVGYATFNYCESLTALTIEDGVEVIGDDAFYGCSSLVDVVIPDSVTTIGSSTFRGCIALESVTIGNGVEAIGDGAFGDCSSLVNVFIGDSVEIVGAFAFQNCQALENITIPDGVTTIGVSAFNSCVSLKNVELGNGINTIEAGAFQFCDIIEEIYYNGTNCQWNKISIGLYNTAITNANLVTLGEHAFGEIELTAGGIGDTCRLQKACANCDDFEGVEFILGDVNEDGVANSEDYDAIAQASACQITLVFSQVLAADINGDGMVDNYDAICFDLAENGVLSSDEIAEMRANAVIPEQ